MPRRRGAVDMTALIRHIQTYIRAQRRIDPKFSRAELARRSGIAGSTLSELMSHPDREPSGRTLAGLAVGMEADPLDLYRIAYPRGSTDAPQQSKRKTAIRTPRRIAVLLQSDPQYGRLLELVELLTPERRTRVLAYVEGLIEAINERR